MNNQVRLTDDELALIGTSLEMTLRAYEKYMETNGSSSLDFQTRKVYKEMQVLHDRLEKEYF